MARNTQKSEELSDNSYLSHCIIDRFPRIFIWTEIKNYFYFYIWEKMSVIHNFSLGRKPVLFNINGFRRHTGKSLDIKTQTNTD